MSTDFFAGVRSSPSASRAAARLSGLTRGVPFLRIDGVNERTQHSEEDPRVGRLAALVPALVRRLLLEHEPAELRGWHRTEQAACLFADISGFTPLVEALAARKKE